MKTKQKWCASYLALTKMKRKNGDKPSQFTPEGDSVAKASSKSAKTTKTGFHNRKGGSIT